jgi:protein phosphatase
VEDIVLLETHIHAVEAQDWYLLCSDGLSDMLNDDDIAAVLEMHADLEQAGPALIAAANEAGGRDNIAVILVAARGGGSNHRSWWPFGQ